MIDTLTGFAVVGLAIVVGYVVGRIDLLGPHARHVLSRLTFFVLSPFLMFTVLSQADVHVLFSSLLPVSAIAAVVVIVLFLVVARLVWRRPLGEALIGALSSGYVNANNIGLPLSLYLLGDAAFPAPVMLLQLLLFAPVSLALLDTVTRTKKSSLWRTIGRTLMNPLIAASILGVLVSVLGIRLPTIVLEPMQQLAHACVPVLLISYGISLYGQRVLGAAGRRRDVLLASTLKLVAMPVIAWAVATFLFGLSGAAVLVVVVLAALPAGQNVFNYAQRYDVGEVIARDAVFVTTVGCVPVILGAVLLLG